MRLAPLVFGAALCATVSRPGLTQVRPLLGTVPRNSEVRILLLDSALVAGRLLALDERQLLLRTVVRPTVARAFFEDRTVAVDSMAHAWTRQGSYWKTGALVGLAVGTASLWGAMNALADELDCGPAQWECGAFSLIAGGVPGALLGALIGGGMARWRVLF
jgi:hypothetical protein